MKPLFALLTLACALAAPASWAQEKAQGPGQSCHAAAAEKKLAGAAKNSYLKKCERDAHAVCTSAAAEKKLGGAAKNSFTQKCVKDAVGAPG